MKNIETLRNNARAIYAGHYNCAQSVLKTCLDDFGIKGAEADIFIKTATGFGGGMGSSGQICGAVSGGIMAMSLKLGYETEDDEDTKEILYEKIRALVSAVRERYGSESCDGILKAAESGSEFAGKNALGQDLCCIDIVGYAAGKVAELLAE